MYVRSLRLTRIKAFDSLELDFGQTDKLGAVIHAGMNFFVGGNASGKSTLLKSLAMALSGPSVAQQQIVSAAGWIAHRATGGQIELQLEWNSAHDVFRPKDPLQAESGLAVGLEFNSEEPGNIPTISQVFMDVYMGRSARLAERGPWNPDAKGWFLAGYGPLRRLTGSSTEAMSYATAHGKLASCVTLFREDAALGESETWLKQEHARNLQQLAEGKVPSQTLNRVRELLNEGLLPSGFKITQVTVDDVYTENPNGEELPMRDLSDGCRGMYALVLDIVRNMAAAFGDADLFGHDDQGRTIVVRPGVVLIDEIEAHLHPSWQRTICEWLRTRFPQVQFFVTTHSPLILQSAGDGGIFLLPLPEELAKGKPVRKLEPHERERIVLGRAEKTLLGEAFGLKRTWSLQAERLVKRWESLDAQRHAGKTLPPAEQQEYSKLSKQLELIFDDPEPQLHHA